MLVTALLWFGALGCGLMAGVYFAFSCFVMTALDGIPREAGVAAMQSVNRVILRSLFMPLFLGTTLAAAILAVAALISWGDPGTAAMLAGGAIYVAGMFGTTMLLNVPLNNALDAVTADDREAAAVWARYATPWARWNHLRTIASLLASALFTGALVAA